MKVKLEIVVEEIDYNDFFERNRKLRQEWDELQQEQEAKKKLKKVKKEV